MKQVIIQVDAFSNQAFGGNPAAVCVLSQSVGDDWMQKVAQEMNLSETAFLLRQDGGFNLRWFTPTVEVPLCGHATLASGHVLWSEGYLETDTIATFYTKSGVLSAQKLDDWIWLDFPVNPSQEISPPTQLSEILGMADKYYKYKFVGQNSLGYLVEVESEELVREIQPNLQLLKTLPIGNVIVTSRSKPDSEYDFISRFFAPGLGIDEDPVTGAAHCCLAPFWRDVLGKDEFLAFQASRRGGVVKVRYSGGNRVFLGGQAVTVMRGELELVS